MQEEVKELFKEQIEIRDRIIDKLLNDKAEAQIQYNKMIVGVIKWIVIPLVIFMSLFICSYFWSDYTVTSNSVTTTNNGNNNNNNINRGDEK